MITREEAIEILQEKHNECKSFYDLAAYPEISYPETGKYMLALRVAIAALRPVSREQVEKVWRGEWIEYEHPHIICCSRCDYGTGPKEKTRFCPHCGAPMTDEAVEMVMERLERLRDE